VTRLSEDNCRPGLPCLGIVAESEYDEEAVMQDGGYGVDGLA